MDRAGCFSWKKSEREMKRQRERECEREREKGCGEREKEIKTFQNSTDVLKFKTKSQSFFLRGNVNGVRGRTRTEKEINKL